MIFSLFMSKYGSDVLTDAAIGPVRVHVERTSSGQALAYPQFAIAVVSQVVVVDGLEVLPDMPGSLPIAVFFEASATLVQAAGGHGECFRPSTAVPAEPCILEESTRFIYHDTVWHGHGPEHRRDGPPRQHYPTAWWPTRSR